MAELLLFITKIVCYFLIKEEKNDMMLNSGFFNERKAKNVIKQKEKEIVRWQKLEF